MKKSLQPAIIACLLIAAVFHHACTKEQANPYDNIKKPDKDTQTTVVLDPNTIEGIHARVFRPTCANSGCHDGTFEPDFRTVQSAYNTLVLHPIIKNNPQGTYSYRVKPGDPDLSLIIARLTYDIDGNSGIMPLAVDPSSDYPAKKDEYIQNIKTWIQNGARDPMGNAPGTYSLVPKMEGVWGRVNNQTLDRKDAGQGAVRIPLGTTQAEILFAFSDDQTPSDQFTGNQIKIQSNPNGFEPATAITLEKLSTPVTGTGYYGGTVQYTHRWTFDPAQYTSLNKIAFFRVYVKDADNPLTEMPTDAGAYYIKNYFSFTIVE